MLEVRGDFDRRFVALFNEHCPRIVRVLTRLCGDPELAADLAQEAFIRLHARGTLPDAAGAWLITVALNLLRNAQSGERRRRELLTLERGAGVHSQAPEQHDAPDALDDAERARVRTALDRLPERERRLLLLRAEGYGYREIADALALNEASIGVLLARAKDRFRQVYEERPDAS